MEMVAEIDSDVLGEHGDEENGNDQERTFPMWVKLPTEIQTLVVDNLDYITRTRLSFCSKHDYDVVNSVPIRITSIGIGHRENFRSCFDFKTYSVIVTINFGDFARKFEFFPMSNNNHTKMVWKNERNEKKSVFVENCGFHETAVDFFEKMLKKAKYFSNSLDVDLNSWPLQERRNEKLKMCKNFRICCDDEDTVKWWLGRVPATLDLLRVQRSTNGRNDMIKWSDEVLDMDPIKTCKVLDIRGICNFSDEKFFGLTAGKLFIESETITDQAINEFIHNWTDGKIRENFSVFKIKRSCEGESEVLKNLTVREWDWDLCEEEENDFWVNHARGMQFESCYQVYKKDGSGESATLFFHNYWVTFAVTGRRITSNGIVRTEYKMPWF